MNKTQRGIMTILRSAVTGENLSLPEYFSLEEALPVIRRHHMVTLAYDGAAHCGIPLKDPAMQQLFQGYGKILIISERQMRQIERICRVFDEHGIEYMPLKGCRMKQLYPKPELRIMGDADILIKLEQYDRISELMSSLGFQEKQTTDHELVWQNDSLYLELHKRLIPSYNRDFFAYFGDGWQLAKIKNGTRYAMTAEDEMVYLFTHFAKHYRDGGIGCRHVVDLWVYRRANPGMDEPYIKAQLETLQLREFYENILKVLAVWFEDGQSDDKTDVITEFLFASGSWGMLESRVISRAVRDSGRTLSGFAGKVRYIWQTLFPSVTLLQEKYTVLKKAPWLLPVVWLVRPFYKILFERKSLKRQERSLEALSDENIKTREQLLHYVGLDFHF